MKAYMRSDQIFRQCHVDAATAFQNIAHVAEYYLDAHGDHSKFHLHHIIERKFLKKIFKANLFVRKFRKIW